jgi:cell division protein YceG involved in septum cleavage
MKRLTVGLALLMAVLISVAWWWVQRDLQAPLTMTSTTVLKVPSGAHSGWVLNYLQKENML